MNFISRTPLNNTLFVIFMIINILDFYTTKILIDIGGIGIEGNPIMLYAMTILGATWAMFTLKTLTLVPMLIFINISKDSFKILPPKSITTGLYIIIFILGLVVSSNFILILLS